MNVICEKKTECGKADCPHAKVHTYTDECAGTCFVMSKIDERGAVTDRINPNCQEVKE